MRLIYFVQIILATWTGNGVNQKEPEDCIYSVPNNYKQVDWMASKKDEFDNSGSKCPLFNLANYMVDPTGYKLSCYQKFTWLLSPEKVMANPKLANLLVIQYPDWISEAQLEAVNECYDFIIPEFVPLIESHMDSTHDKIAKISNHNILLKEITKR